MNSLPLCVVWLRNDDREDQLVLVNDDPCFARQGAAYSELREEIDSDDLPWLCLNEFKA